MINLLGCTKENFVRLLQLMEYKQEKNEEDLFTYKPQKNYRKIKKNNAKYKEDNPFNILSEVRFK